MAPLNAAAAPQRPAMARGPPARTDQSAGPPRDEARAHPGPGGRGTGRRKCTPAMPPGGEPGRLREFWDGTAAAVAAAAEPMRGAARTGGPRRPRPSKAAGTPAARPAKHATIFNGQRRRRPVGRGGGAGTQWRDRAWSAVLGGSFAGIVAVTANMIARGYDIWPIGAVMSVVSAAALAHILLRGRRLRSPRGGRPAGAAASARMLGRGRGDGARMRRLIRLSDRVAVLCDSLPRRTDVETLAVLYEIRICYTEAFELAEGLGADGRVLVDTMRKVLANFNHMYDMQSGSLRRTDANAAEFAAAMRELGRDVDGSTRR